jgi:hypothetical protein
MTSPETPELPTWVFWSTRESIDNDIPSVTAIAETIIAVPLYWWIAIYFETYLLLLISAIIAPLVLLRSDQSIALGVQWFTSWEERWNDRRSYRDFRRSERRSILAMVGVAILTASVGFYLFAGYFSKANEWWRVLLGGLGVGVFSSMMVFGGTAAVGGGAFARALAAAGGGIGAGVIAIALTLAGVVVEKTAGWETMAGALVGFSIGVTAYKVMERIGSPIEKVVLATVSAAAFAATIIATAEGMVMSVSLLFGFGFVLGVWIISLIVRIGATLRHIGSGIRNLPGNFRRLILCTSPRQQPELVPGLKPTETQFSLAALSRAFNRDRRSRDFFRIVFAFSFWPMAMLLWLLPGWLYRITLKSTAWFWWPLAYLGGDLRRAKHPELLRQRIMETLWAKVSIALAAMTILGFLVSNILLSGAAAQDNPFLSVLGFVFLIDWRSIGLWQVLAVAAALLSVAILLWIDTVEREYRYAKERDDRSLLAKAARGFGWIERVARLRLLLVLGFWLLVGGHTLLYFNSLKCTFDVPPSIERQAQWLYGERMPRRCAAA